MHLLYIGYYTSDDLLYEIQNRGINNMSVARQKFESNLLTGIIEKKKADDLYMVSYVPVNKTFSVPEYSVIAGEKVKHFPINRHSIRSILNARKAFSEYLSSLGEEVLADLHVLMYDVNPVFLGLLLALKRKYNIKLITLCAELSILRRSNNIYCQIRNRIFAHYERKFDGFILFAKPMAEALKCQGKPHIVMEGIAPDLFGIPKRKNKNIVMYAGGLGRDNNMNLLIDACTGMDKLDELWICGTGKDEPLVKKASEDNPKIKYFGMITNEEVRQLEQEAKVLVNIRQPDAVITRYSFPSKLLEYMAAGTIVVSSRLEGIPQEYFDYLITLESVETVALRRALQSVFSMKSEEYVSRIRAAQEFIFNNKNRNVQAGRVLDFTWSV